MPMKLSTKGIKRLEMTMRDVLGGLEDAAIFMNYQSTVDAFDVLSIEPVGRPNLEKSKVIPINKSSENNIDADIVEYLIQRELKRSA